MDRRKRSTRVKPSDMDIMTATLPAAAHSTGMGDSGALSSEEPSPEQIATRAYELYLRRGGTDGHALEDWLAAEHELRHR